MTDWPEDQAAERFRSGELRTFGDFMTEVYGIYAAQHDIKKGPAERMWRMLHHERGHIEKAAQAVVFELWRIEDDPLDPESFFYQLAIEGAESLMTWVDSQECFK